MRIAHRGQRSAEGNFSLSVNILTRPPTQRKRPLITGEAEFGRNERGGPFLGTQGAANRRLRNTARELGPAGHLFPGGCDSCKFLISQLLTALRCQRSSAPSPL